MVTRDTKVIVVNTIQLRIIPICVMLRYMTSDFLVLV